MKKSIIIIVVLFSLSCQINRNINVNIRNTSDFDLSFKIISGFDEIVTGYLSQNTETEFYLISLTEKFDYPNGGELGIEINRDSIIYAEYWDIDRFEDNNFYTVIFDSNGEFSLIE